MAICHSSPLCKKSIFRKILFFLSQNPYHLPVNSFLLFFFLLTGCTAKPYQNNPHHLAPVPVLPLNEPLDPFFSPLVGPIIGGIVGGMVGFPIGITMGITMGIAASHIGGIVGASLGGIIGGGLGVAAGVYTFATRVIAPVPSLIPVEGYV